MISLEESLAYRQAYERNVLLSYVHEDLQAKLKDLEWPFYRDVSQLNLHNMIFSTHWFQKSDECWFWYSVQNAIEMFQIKDAPAVAKKNVY